MRSCIFLPCVLLLACAKPPPGPIDDPDALDLTAPPPGPMEDPDLAMALPDLSGPPPPPTDMAMAASDMAASPNLVRFIAMGDTGKANDGQRQVAAGIVKKCMMSGCDFVILLGDNIYDSGISSPDDPQMQEKFEIPYMAVNLPFYAVLGNHDYGADGLGTDFARGANEVVYTMRSMKWRMPDAYYRFAFRHVEFFGMDTNMAMFNRVDRQKPDMITWVNASTATWRIAMGHHPYLSNGRHGNAGFYDGVPLLGAGVKSLLDDTVCGKVDLYLSGHDHNRQWMTGKCKMKTELVVSGAGASTTEIKGSQPTHFQKDTLGFLYVRIEDRTLTAEFVDADGNTEFTRTLTK